MNLKRWNIKDLLKVTTDYLNTKNIESPRLSAEILLAHQLRIPRIDLYLHYEKPLHRDEVDGYRALIRRRLSREPIQYITGKQEFWSLSFIVNPNVLIPRPETEIIVEQILKLFQQKKIEDSQNINILDIGTGSGAITVSIARELKNANLFASDLSRDALLIARQNAKENNVGDRIEFRLGSIFEPFENDDIRFDIISSNPPYIISEDINTLEPEIKNYEPRLALDGGEDGMSIIVKLIKNVPKYLKPMGWVLLEMDSKQTQKAIDLLDKTQQFEEITRINDYAHKYRVVMARKMG